MKRFLLGLVAVFAIGIGVSVSQNAPSANPPVGLAGAYNASPKTCTDGQACWLQTDVNGRLAIGGTLTPTGTQDANLLLVNGAAVQTGHGVASGSIRVELPTDGTGVVNVLTQASSTPAAATATKSLLAGAQYNTTLPTFTDGQQGALQVGTRGSLSVQIIGQDGTGSPSIASAPTDAVVNSNTSMAVRPYNLVFSGSTWERTFTCANSTPIGVTAGTGAQEILSLTASQIIRVCSFTITSNVAGTAQFTYGTGTNCGSGNTPLTGAMNIAASGNITISGGNNSVLRTASANALCLTAVTGNVFGFISYAKF